jgi:hypothetical protein
MPKDKLERPERVRTTLQELEILTGLKESIQWVIVKRVATRYIAQLRRASFKLTEQDPQYLAARHAEFAGQALGIRMLIRFIDESGKRLSKLEQ